MQIPKDKILEFVTGDLDRLELAVQELPDPVDTERDATLLEDFGIDIVRARSHFNGAGGASSNRNHS